MKCPGNDVLQAYIDSELEIGMRKNIEAHLTECDRCKSQLAVLKENDDFVFGKLKNYRQNFEEYNVPSSHKPWEASQNVDRYNKGVFKYMLKYKKITAAACAALLVTTCITVQPVKAAISSVLSIFRVENVKGITVTLEDIEQIQKQIASGKGDISLDKMGSIKIEGGKERSASKEEVKKISEIPVTFPTAIGNEPSNINITDPGTMYFTLNVKNVNQIMKSFGATKLLPESLDGKTFKVDFAGQVTMNYAVNGKSVTVMETRIPELTVPEGVNVDEVYNAVVGMPIFPKNLQTKLKSIEDWKNTLYIPVVESEMTEVDINGVKGYTAFDKDNSGDVPEAVVIWFDKGVYRAVSGRIDSSEILKIARSMK